MGIYINTYDIEIFKMSIHRKTYIKHYGIIPIDENGRTYDIHHIDGNRKNNDISNLIALPIEEHLKIHKNQGDNRAVHAILLRLNADINEIKYAAKLAANERVDKGIHHWLGGDHQRKLAKKLKDEGKLYFCSELHKIRTKSNNKILIDNNNHNFQSPENKERIRKMNAIKLSNGTHPFLNGAGRENSRRRIADGSHQFLDKVLQKELSNRAKLKNSYIIQRIDNLGIIKEYIGYEDAIRDTPGTTRKRIASAIKKNLIYSGYLWNNLGKGINL